MKVTVRARILRETDRAIQIEGGAWLPKSQVEIGEVGADGTSPIEMPEWLAMEKSLDLLVEEDGS